jgi:peptidoglycan hydrolase-like protein with peptidoglycan-binding domain
MKKRHGIAAAVAATLVITSTTASADSNLGAFAVGAAVGALINNQVGKNQRQKRATQQRSSANSYQRQQNREVQSALNGFGFPVGAVDGSLGKRSRAAIANYQSYMGYPATGYLDDFQRSQLVGSHQRMQAGGGAAYPEVVANEGTKGLLKAFADPTYADRYRGNGVQQPGVYNDQGAVTRAAVGGGAVGGAAVAGGQDAPLAFAPLAPLNNAPARSMASHCELVVGMTQANQGVVLASNVQDPEQALGEQFCEARSFAMTQSQGLAAQSGQTDAQLAAACTQIADALEPASAQIGTGDVKLVATQAQQITNSIFQGNMDTASGYGQICLGMGYRQDDAKMALGGATVMLATGQMPYAEIMGHHTRWGFGATASPAASTSWYQTALSSMEQGAQPVFVPSKTAERNAIIKASLGAAPAGNGLAPLQASGGNGLALPALNIGGN